MSTYGATIPWSPAGSHAPKDLRITRRGRLARTLALVVLMGVLALSLVDTLASRSALADDTPPTAPVLTQSVVVEQGDSLWLIAERAAPESDPRGVVTQIRELNGLRSNVIQPGQVLLIPAAQ